MNLSFSLAFFGAILSGIIALLTLAKTHRSLARWAFAFGMGALAVESFCVGLATDALLPDKVVYWQTLAFIVMSFLPAIWLVFSLTYARGSYSEFLHEWRFCLLALFLVPAGACFGFRKYLVFAAADADGSWIFRIGPAGIMLNIVAVLSWVLVLVNLEATFRASVGTLRWRIKYIVLGLGLLFAVRAYTGTQILLFRSVSLPRTEINSIALLVACLLMLRSLYRAGHFEVNVYPSQAVLQNSITLLLAGGYLIFVGILAKIVAFFGGDTAFELKAFIILLLLVCLAVVLLSDRARLYIKQFASRHFQRPLYDYRTVWRLFTEGTTRRVEAGDLCQAVTRLTSDVFQALSVSIWVFDEKKERLTLAASTSFAQEGGAELNLTHEEIQTLIGAFKNNRDPIDLETSTVPWAGAVRRAHPGEFARGGDRICVPMVPAGEPLGFMVLGDRVGGLSYSTQDFELLKCGCDQAAAGLLNIQLNQRVSQSKQLEAFQAMSAFFIHDLKNTASTLSLMLQNLPVHYQDPVFREDALRGISKTVSHIDQLISRLTILRHDLALQIAESDLNGLVNEIVKAHQQTPGIQIRTDLGKLPRVALDPVQIQKVVTNLMLNAEEALSSGGHIDVTTDQRNGWAAITVKDDGCGMSQEFIRSSLFRPFKTTKQKGIGIGMFHCKMIVDAHQGKIEVESKPGAGTLFRVLLPLSVRGA
jgi:putative PEP-CTERM system histidine kinase